MQDIDSSIAFGRFRMDLTRRVLLADGQPVALHARAFDILEYLVASRDRAVTRDEIIGHVWRGLVVGENNLSVQMSTLRRVLAQHGGGDLIVTVPHRGYQFIETAPAAAPIAAAMLPTAQEPPLGETAATSGQDRTRRSLAWQWPAAGFALLAFLLMAILAGRREAPVPGPQAGTAAPPFDPPPHSVAVLAFTNLSGAPSQDYLSDGLSEELIESLSQIRQVQVTARTSSFFFKGKTATIKDIALALNVAAVVEGSVRRQGNHLRIEVRLTDARTGFQLWSRPFDSDLGDMLKVEADIAAQVADGLQVKLAAGRAPDGNTGGTANARALDAFLHGVQSIRHETVQSYRDALASFQAAIDADHDFALAYAGKADALVEIANVEDVPDPATDGWMYSASLSAAERSVQLASGSGLTHAALSNILANSLDLRRAWVEADQAQLLDPGNSTVNLIFSGVAISVGRIDSAMQAARRVVELDPLREDGWVNLGQQFRIARDFDSAFKAYQHAQTVAGTETPLIAYERALAYITMGNPERALDISLSGSDWMRLECRAIAQHALGRPQDAKQTFAALVRQDGNNFNYVYAEIYAQWGETVEALVWLAKARKLHDSGLANIKIDPMMDPLRNEPGFKAIEASLSFPD